MTEDLLRRWVRGELPEAERREVSQWVVRCTSPELGPLLHAMQVELEDEARDAKLQARGGLWARLVAAWNELLDAGRAYASAGDDRGLVLATVAPDQAVPVLRLEVSGSETKAVFRPPHPHAGEAALYATDDAGAVLCLSAVSATSDRDPVIPVGMGERPVVWAVQAPVLPREVDPMDELHAALTAANSRQWAVRVIADRET